MAEETTTPIVPVPAKSVPEPDARALLQKVLTRLDEQDEGFKAFALQQNKREELLDSRVRTIEADIRDIRARQDAHDRNVSDAKRDASDAMGRAIEARQAAEKVGIDAQGADESVLAELNTVKHLVEDATDKLHTEILATAPPNVEELDAARVQLKRAAEEYAKVTAQLKEQQEINARRARTERRWRAFWRGFGPVATAALVAALHSCQSSARSQVPPPVPHLTAPAHSAP